MGKLGPYRNNHLPRPYQYNAMNCLFSRFPLDLQLGKKEQTEALASLWELKTRSKTQTALGNLSYQHKGCLMK